MLWYLGCGTTYLLMWHKLLVIDNNYQNTELRKRIAFHAMMVWLLVCLVMSIVQCCMLLIAVKSIYVGHNIDDPIYRLV